MKTPFGIVLLLVLSISCRPSHRVGELAGVEPNRTLTFEDIPWELTDLNGKPLPTQQFVKITFTSVNHSIEGTGGCNKLSGTYTVKGKEVAITAASTKMNCDGKMEIENAFTQALADADKYSLDGGTMQLKKQGAVIANFKVWIRKSY